MINTEIAIEVAERVNEMKQEIRSLRSVLRKYWTHEGTPEPFVQKGIQQLQARETADQETERRQKLFRAASDDSALWESLRAEVVNRMDV